MDLQPLRVYQERAVSDALSTELPTVIVAPTGSGKSRMGAECIARTPGRWAWVVHRTELVDQARELFRPHGIQDRAEVVTFQSGRWPDADAVIIDECHHVASDEWRAIFARYPGRRFIGLTATPERADGRPLGGELFSRMVVAAQYSELIQAGHLVDCRVIRPDTPLERGLAQDPVAAYQAHAAGLYGFVFVPRVIEAERLAARFSAAGIPAAAVSESTGKRQRAAAVQALRDRTVRLIVNVYTMTEGVDIPHAEVCMLARTFGHAGQYLQAAGRVLRAYPGKREALLLDLVGASHLHGWPTEDRLYSLEGNGCRAKSQSVTTCQLCGCSYETGPAACPRCGFELPHKDWKPLRVMSLELREVYRGKATPVDAKTREYYRIRGIQRAKGYSLDWTLRAFRDLFGSAPALDDVTTEERAAEYARFAAIGYQRGFKPGFAGARYREMFGVWPSRLITHPPVVVLPGVSHG